MSNLEPDFGSAGTTRRDFTLTPTRTQQTPFRVNPLAPRVPDDMLERFQSAAPTPARRPTAGLDTSAVIANLPDARKSFVTKYERLGPSIKSLPQPVRAQLLKMDLQRVEQGQFPLTDQETLGAIVTAVRGEPATKQAKKESIWETVTSFPGDAVRDVAAIGKSIPHMPAALWNEARAAGSIVADSFTHNSFLGNRDEGKTQAMYEANRAKGMNPWESFWNLPLARLIPGAYTTSQISRGPEGLREIANHPVMVGLDVLPYASKAASGTKVGRIATEEAASTGSKATPLRAVLTRRALPEGELSATGSQLVPARLGTPIAKVTDTGLGQLASRAFGKDARNLSTKMAVGDQQMTDIIQGNRPLANPIHQAARDAYELASDGRSKAFPSLTDDRVIDVTRALEQDRNLLADPTKFTAEEQAFASRVIELTDVYEGRATASGELLKLNDEVYDLKTGRKILKAQERVGKTAAKVDDGLFTQVARVKSEIDARTAANGGRASTLDKITLKRIEPLYAALDDYFNNPQTTTTLADLEKASRTLQRSKTRLGGSSQVGPKIAPAADIRLDTLARIRQEVKAAADAEKKLTKLNSRAPDRWIPAVHAEAKRAGTDYLIQKGVSPEEASRVILEQDFRAYPDLFNRDVLTDLIRDAEPIWQKLKAAGQDPVFVHRVAPGREKALAMPRVQDFIGDLSQTKKRKLYEIAPYNEDVTVGLAAQGVEIVSREIAERVLPDIADTFGLIESDLRDRLLSQARDAAAKNPRLVQGHVTELMNRDWQRFEPEKFLGGGKARTVSSASDTIWLPKNVARVMEDYYHPRVNPIFTVLSPLNHMFRTAVLPLLPRWHFNNIVGNAFTATLEHGPGVFRKWPEARRLIKAFKAGEDVIPDELGFSFNVARKELAQSKYETANSWAAKFQTGQRNAKAWNVIQAAKNAGSAVIQKSYDLNSLFDDTTRAMSYLDTYGKTAKKAARSGITGDAAEAMSRDAALQTVNRVFQNWNALTPIERNVLRQVFPFYSFTSYAMRFVTSFPAHHPLRAAIMSNLTRSVLDDLGADIPPSMLDYLTLGAPDPNGDQRAISLRGMNPLGDVADNFTLAGFLAGLNPVGQAVAKSTGAELGGFTSPSTKTYDPMTGKMVNSRPGFLTALVGSTVPQVDLVRRLTGGDNDFNTLARRDPAAAQRQIASGFGIPAQARDINFTAEAMKAEIKRQAVQRDVFRRAIQTGDFSEARDWPALVPLLEQIQRLRDGGGLAAYNPIAGPSVTPASAVRSVTPWS